MFVPVESLPLDDLLESSSTESHFDTTDLDVNIPILYYEPQVPGEDLALTAILMKSMAERAGVEDFDVKIIDNNNPVIIPNSNHFDLWENIVKQIRANSHAQSEEASSNKRKLASHEDDSVEYLLNRDQDTDVKAADIDVSAFFAEDWDGLSESPSSTDPLSTQEVSPSSGEDVNFVNKSPIPSPMPAPVSPESNAPTTSYSQITEKLEPKSKRPRFNNQEVRLLQSAALKAVSQEFLLNEARPRTRNGKLYVENEIEITSHSPKPLP